MKLRFAVNQGEALRRGIDCESSTATVVVNPSELPEEDRHLLADRMRPGDIGIYEVCSWYNGQPMLTCELICASLPDYQGLMEAVRKNAEKNPRPLARK